MHLVTSRFDFRRFRVANSSNPKGELQALRVPIVAVLAGGAGCTLGWASVSNTGTLSVFGGGATVGWWGGWVTWVGWVGGGNWVAWVGVGSAGGGANWAESDVGEGDGRIWVVLLDGCWDTNLGVARSASISETGSANWVGRVEPFHVGCVIVPDGHGEDHRRLKSLVEPGHATLGLEVVVIAESGLLLRAEVVGDLVGCSNASDVAHGVLDNLAVLDVEALDACERTGVGSAGGDELGHHGELLRGINGLSRAEEGLVTHAVAVEVTSVLVAETRVAVIAVTTLDSRAAGEPVACAGMRGVGRRVQVRLPDVHLGTAGSVATTSGVRIGGGWGPVEEIGLWEKC